MNAPVPTPDAALQRSQAIDRFLATSGFAGAVRTKIAGDASFRHYERIAQGGRNAILMDAPPDKEDTRPFIKVAQFLTAQGYSAPLILAKDESQGFLLLEDLGDDLYSRLLGREPREEEALYRAATDVLIDMYRRSSGASALPVLPLYDADLLTRELALFTDWYLPAALGEKAVEAAKSYHALWEKLIASIPSLRLVPVLRDYHADNLLWLPGRPLAKRVGLLDFQDAVIGSPAYDMVSFLEDARRDVQSSTVQSAIAHYLKETGIDRDAFLMSYALLGAQRNLKIIGIFSRLAKRDGKAHYLNFLPRVWSHLKTDLAHPALAPLKDWAEKHLHPINPAHRHPAA